MNDYIDITQELKDTHKKFDLCSNIMYIQGQMFIITTSKKIKSVAIQGITDSMIPILNKSFYNKFIVYNQSGLKIQRIYVHSEFKPMEDTFKCIDIKMNYATAQEHVPKIERAIRTIKE